MQIETTVIEENETLTVSKLDIASEKLEVDRLIDDFNTALMSKNPSAPSGYQKDIGNKAKQKVVQVIYMPDSMASIRAANMFRAMNLMPRSYDFKPSDNFFNFNVETAQLATVTSVPTAVVWIGVNPMEEIFIEKAKGCFKKTQHIVIPEKWELSDDWASLLVAKFIDEQRQLDMGVTSYVSGAIVGAYCSLIKDFGMAYDYPGAKHPDFIASILRDQKEVNDYYVSTTKKEDLYKQFEITVTTMHHLGCPGGIRAIADAELEYNLAFSEARGMIGRSGRRERVLSNDRAVDVWVTYITQRFWMAKRALLLAGYSHMNISMCRTGTMMYTDVDAKQALKQPVDVFRSA